MSKKRLSIILLSVFLTLMAIIAVLVLTKEEQEFVSVVPISDETELDTDFDFKIIKKVSGETDNYLVSPLSIVYAFSMLREGAAGDTRKELDDLLGNYQVLNVNNVKDRIGIANALFINKSFKKGIKKTYINRIEDKYKGEIIFDSFLGPERVNAWIKNKTFDMIPDALDTLDPSSILVLVNTVAIDTEWEKEFKTENTSKEEFTLKDGSKMDTAMMHATNGVSYIKSDKAQGIIKNYKSYDESTNLEYIAILPKGDIKDYLKSFNKEELDKLLNSARVADGEKLEVNLSLPKYTYDFNYKRIKSDLFDLGVRSVFLPTLSQLNKISDTYNLYADEVVHKTHIEVSEQGTKAAAVTAITFKNTALIMDEKEIINIKFNKPFIYIIKDKQYDNIWFFGVVYKPMKWEDNK